MNRPALRLWWKALAGGWPGLLLFVACVVIALVLEGR